MSDTQGYAAWIDRHRRSLFFFLAILVLGGIGMALRLPVALFPQVSFPRVVVSLDAGDRPAEEMMALVTIPVEEALRAIPGVENVRSTTSRGSAEISVNFGWGLDMTAATLQVEAAVAQAAPTLPAGTATEVRRMDPTVFPVIAYSLTSSVRSDTYLYDLAYYQIRPRLSAIPGVARVGVLGGAREEIHVITDPARLERFDLTVDDVAQALSATNIVSAAGVIEDEYKLYLVLTDNRFSNLQEIDRTVLRSGTDGLVLLEDVATIERAPEPQRTIVTADGQRAVLFQIYQQPGGNTVQIARDVKDALTATRGALPADVQMANWYDQSELILAAETSVRDAVLIGILLAMLVLFSFLRDGRVTLIVAIVVPASLAATALLLGVLGQSFNLMTLGGMAAAVGLIIDDAIVVVEHIIRRLEEQRAVPTASDAATHKQGVLQAAREFTRPLVGSSLATIVIFTPLAFLSGVTGAFFRALSLTMAVGLVISFFIAWLIVPLLVERLVRPRDAAAVDSRLERAIHRHYDGVLRRLLTRPVLVFVFLVPFLLVGYLGYRATGSGFFPSTDEGGFILDYRGTPGTSLTEMDRLLRQVEAILQATPEVLTYSRRTGIQLGGGLSESNEGDFFVRLRPPPRRGIEEIMNEVRSTIEQQVPGLEIELAQLMEDLIGDLTAVPQPIEVQLYSDQGTLLDSLAPRIAAQIGRIPGVVDVNDGITLAGDALVVRVDRNRAALRGVDPDAVSRTLSDLIGGAVTTSLPQGEKMTEVRVWIPEHERSSIRDLENLLLHSPDGRRLSVRQVATIERVSGQPQITRDDLKRMTAVTARISGRDLGSTIRDVQTLLNQAGTLPPSVYYRLGGLYAQQQIAFRGLLAVFAAAVVLVFLVLLFLYERFAVVLAMLLTTGLAFGAVYIGLWLTGTELNISAMMGLTMIVGIVTEVSVFYVTEVRKLEGEVADPVQRLIQAGSNRMRPIAMTTLAAILALAPLALGLGQGAGMLQPLAIAIEAGLLAQFPLVLLVLPVLLWLFRALPHEPNESAPHAMRKDS
ncbi:transporter [Rhodothermaceae bacterium RA]|nr:transporter [Rhodothermaceae bacterium RA]